jgi:hypothetical protein
MKKYWFLGMVVLSLLFSACGTAATTAAPTAAPAEPAAPSPASPLPPTKAPPPTEAQPPTAVPTQEPTDTAAPAPTQPPAPAAMDGKALMEDRCDICHPLMMIELSNYSSPLTWRATVEEMIGKGAILNDQEKEILIAYLMANYVKK